MSCNLEEWRNVISSSVACLILGVGLSLSTISSQSVIVLQYVLSSFTYAITVTLLQTMIDPLGNPNPNLPISSNNLSWRLGFFFPKHNASPKRFTVSKPSPSSKCDILEDCILTAIFSAFPQFSELSLASPREDNGSL